MTAARKLEAAGWFRELSHWLTQHTLCFTSEPINTAPFSKSIEQVENIDKMEQHCRVPILVCAFW